jgi:ribosomal protein L32
MAAIMRSLQTLNVPRMNFMIGSLFEGALGTTVRQNGFQVPAWLGPILWAVPKKKTSHSKKRMRASNKGLKQAENITSCPVCGNAKLMHHVCRHCYQEFKHRSKLASH